MIRFLTALSLLSFFACSNPKAPTTDTPTDSIDYAQVDSLRIHQKVTLKVGPVTELKSVPRDSFPYQGNFLSAKQWTEARGTCTLVLSEIPHDNQKGYTERLDYQLFAYLYLEKDSLELRWKMNDYIGCYCDCEMWFEVPGEITDIDQDGEAEVRLLYAMNDRCDASPLPVKQLLYWRDHKFKIDGAAQEYFLYFPKSNPKYWDFTRMYNVMDPGSFAVLPEAIGEYALKGWYEYKKNDWEEATADQQMVDALGIPKAYPYTLEEMRQAAKDGPPKKDPFNE